ncbi:MAG TPA: sulfotransferase [Candidatus Limnocylindrales bacterium]|nr:sulfotransferase [Candidatus Limnocylindrales bacterium]
MEDNVMFVVGSPRSGSTMLARMISSHSQIYGRPEPHLLTPLAHLGYYGNVDKAPYDHVLAAESTKEFVADLPRGEQDYIDACRAYCDTLYGRMLATKPDKKIFLDKTPAYALVLDFIARIYPNARYVVLTRHPLAVFSSYAESFFDSDYQTAHQYNPLLERYVPAIAKFLRERKVPIFHVVYEKLVADPEPMLRGIFEFVGVPHEESAVEYGKHKHEAKGLGDPIGVAKHSRPSTESIDKWAVEIASDPARLALCRDMIARLDPADLALWGHPLETLWDPLERAAASGRKPAPKKLDRYRLERRAIVTLRAQVQKSPQLRKLLQRVRLASDVLLRE